MKQLIVIAIFFCLSIENYAQKPIETLLLQLDSTIAQAGKFSRQKEKSIAGLRSSAEQKKTVIVQYQLFKHLYLQYQSYKYDSAHLYANKMVVAAEQLKNKNLLSEAKSAQAFSCISAGLYKEAAEISASIDSTSLSPDYKTRLYAFLAVSNLNFADFSGGEPYRTHYRALSRRFSQLEMSGLQKNSAQKLFAEIRIAQLDNDFPKAISLSEKFLRTTHPDLHNQAIVLSTLGYFYEVQRDTLKAMQCFAQAAIADIQSATKETSAIRQLAELLYKHGDVQRAYAYATFALNDANFYNARQRKIEVGQILPIIEAGRFEIIQNQRNKLVVSLIAISLLLLAFGVAVVIIQRQKKRLNAAGKLILDQNIELQNSNSQLMEAQQLLNEKNEHLQHTNERLNEANRIKEEYIGYFFNNNLAYVEKMDELRKMVARKVRAGQHEELLKLPAAAENRREREELFALFDRIFLSLFPDFVERYNDLFNEENRLEVTQNILPAELRIFALIRLGITSSDRIATFLDFSLSTVKNYKTKARNRSRIPNELFEQKIMEIGSADLK